MTRKKKLNLTISPEHKVKALKLAKKLNRSRSNLFEWLIDRAYEDSEGKITDLPSSNASVRRGKLSG